MKLIACWGKKWEVSIQMKWFCASGGQLRCEFLFFDLLSLIAVAAASSGKEFQMKWICARGGQHNQSFLHCALSPQNFTFKTQMNLIACCCNNARWNESVQEEDNWRMQVSPHQFLLTVRQSLKIGFFHPSGKMFFFVFTASLHINLNPSEQVI